MTAKRRRDQRGLITLEWLLIVGAAAGLAALSVLAVSRVLDNTTDQPPDPLVRVTEARIAASFVEADAEAKHVELRDDGNPATYYHDPGAGHDSAFRDRCEVVLADSFDDIVRGTPQWDAPVPPPPPPSPPLNPTCELTFRPELFEP